MPNYGLGPNDIERFNVGPACMDHITLHQLKESGDDDPIQLAAYMSSEDPRPTVAFELGAHVDTVFRGTRSPPLPLPPAIILDYTYGVAAYKCWRSHSNANGGLTMMENYHKAHYENIPPHMQPSNDNNHPSSSSEESNNCEKDPDYEPSPTQRHYASTREGDVMATAMDELNSVLMSIQGITPQEAANRKEKQMMEEELKAQEASRSKVKEWMTSEVGGS
jgi:hypothetical protein